MAATTTAGAAYLDDAKRVGGSVGTFLRQTWWLGLGVFAVIGEQTARAANALVDKGREIEPSVVRPVRSATAGLAGATQRIQLGRATGALRDRMPSLLSGASVPKEEFDKLREEVNSLRRRLGESLETEQKD